MAMQLSLQDGCVVSLALVWGNVAAGLGCQGQSSVWEQAGAMRCLEQRHSSVQRAAAECQ
jgi:hypothetical protein